MQSKETATFGNKIKSCRIIELTKAIRLKNLLTGLISFDFISFDLVSFELISKFSEDYEKRRIYEIGKD